VLDHENKSDSHNANRHKRKTKHGSNLTAAHVGCHDLTLRRNHCEIQRKVEVCLCGGTAPLILNLDTGSLFSFTPRLLYQREKEPPMGGFWSRPGNSEEERSVAADGRSLYRLSQPSRLLTTETSNLVRELCVSLK
jgi:hypothetical protein